MSRARPLFRPLVLPLVCTVVLGLSRRSGADPSGEEFAPLAVVPLAVAVDPPEPPADPVAEALAKPIIGPGRTRADALALAEPRIPRVPQPKSAEEWKSFAKAHREAVFEKVFFRGRAAAWRDAKTRVEMLDAIDGGPGYRIRKLRYEVVPGLWIPALLYEPDRLEGKVPVVLNVVGHDSLGMASGPEQVRCINLAKRGMIALHPEWLGMGLLAAREFQHDQINHIDLCGSSGIALQYLALTRAVDLLLGLEHADPERLAATGLSGGGWQTIFVSAFDPRVKLAAPVAGYSDFRTKVLKDVDLGDSEQAPVDFAAVTDYAILTALLAPRPALLIYNDKDECCFKSDVALPPLLEAAGPIYRIFDKPHNLRSHVNHDPGTHNYLKDNRQAFYRMLGDFFFPGRADYSGVEAPTESEMKPPAELAVPLPADNSSPHSLALSLSKSLPIDPAPPADRAAATAWRDARRARVREVARPSALGSVPSSETLDEKAAGGVRIVRRRVQVGGWGVPVVELTPTPAAGSAKPSGLETTLLVADAGRSSAEARAAASKLLAEGRRVVLTDPFLIGESRFPDREYLFALLVATVGERPIGIQAGQIAAVARLARRRPEGGDGPPVSVLAIGPRTSLMALVAAAVDDSAIGALELRGSLGSLKEAIEAQTPYAQSPELFCFGLLEAADVFQLAAACAPRPVRFVDPSPRLQAETAGLKTWYKAWGVDLD